MIQKKIILASKFYRLLIENASDFEYVTEDDRFRRLPCLKEFEVTEQAWSFAPRKKGVKNWVFSTRIFEYENILKVLPKQWHWQKCQEKFSTFLYSFEENPDNHSYNAPDIKQLYEGKGEFWHNIEAKHCQVRQKNCDLGKFLSLVTVCFLFFRCSAEGQRRNR